MYAAGLTLKEDNYLNFKKAFEDVVKNTIHEDSLMPEIQVDAEINLSDITPKFIRILKQFEPFGPLNMTPVFLTKNLIDTGFGKKIGQAEEHIRLFVKQNSSEGIAGIGFGLGNKLDSTTNRQPFQAVYCIDENEWNGNVSLQLRLKDIKQDD